MMNAIVGRLRMPLMNVDARSARSDPSVPRQISHCKSLQLKELVNSISFQVGLNAFILLSRHPTMLTQASEAARSEALYCGHSAQLQWKSVTCPESSKSCVGSRWFTWSRCMHTLTLGFKCGAPQH
jgi:hypothetical protein